jgi:hypothetical protein
MKLPLFIWVGVLILGIGLSLQAGEIYQWIDEDGVQHFTDGPPPPGAQIVEGLSETDPDDTQPYTGQAENEANPALEDRDNNPNMPEDTEAAEGEGNSATYREDYWRRRGWGDDESGNEGNGAVQGAENRPAGPEETESFDGSEDDPTERKID